MEKVSVIIPTYNRFNDLLHAIDSVKNQTYKNIEIIVINDCSTQEEYYTFDFKTLGENVYVIHLPKNSRQIFGKVAGGGNARSIGMMIASGEYIAFLDDDDYWLPTKTEKQIKAMKETGCEMSCTGVYSGKDRYSKDFKYPVWHYKGVCWEILQQIFKNSGKLGLLFKMYEKDTNIWTKESFDIHNCAITTSVIIKNTIPQKAGYFPLKAYAEDYAYWKKIIKYTNCVCVREPLIYYIHANGLGTHY